MRLDQTWSSSQMAPQPGAMHFSRRQLPSPIWTLKWCPQQSLQNAWPHRMAVASGGDTSQKQHWQLISSPPSASNSREAGHMHALREEAQRLKNRVADDAEERVIIGEKTGTCLCAATRLWTADEIACMHPTPPTLRARE